MSDYLEEQFEAFEGDVRKLEELVGQLELWSDEYTINHKKEEVRLPEYIELHQNLEVLKEELDHFITCHEGDMNYQERLLQGKQRIASVLEAYKVTEETIHDWIREIKEIYILIGKSSLLENNKAYIQSILEA